MTFFVNILVFLKSTFLFKGQNLSKFGLFKVNVCQNAGLKIKISPNLSKAWFFFVFVCIVDNKDLVHFHSCVISVSVYA